MSMAAMLRPPRSLRCLAIAVRMASLSLAALLQPAIAHRLMTSTAKPTRFVTRIPPSKFLTAHARGRSKISQQQRHQDMDARQNGERVAKWPMDNVPQPE